MKSIPIEEQETTISYCRDSKVAKIWSNDRTVWTKLDKLCNKSTEYACIEEQKDRDGDVIAKVYIIRNKGLISFRSAKKVLTEAQRELAKERLNKR
jgi:hypothetical protein